MHLPQAHTTAHLLYQFNTLYVTHHSTPYYTDHPGFHNLLSTPISRLSTSDLGTLFKCNYRSIIFNSKGFKGMKQHLQKTLKFQLYSSCRFREAKENLLSSSAFQGEALGFALLASYTDPLPCWTICRLAEVDYRVEFCPAQDPGLTSRCCEEGDSRMACLPDCSDVPVH